VENSEEFHFSRQPDRLGVFPSNICIISLISDDFNKIVQAKGFFSLFWVIEKKSAPFSTARLPFRADEGHGCCLLLVN
jgi:hypothetical protein